MSGPPVSQLICLDMSMINFPQQKLEKRMVVINPIHSMQGLTFHLKLYILTFWLVQAY